MMIGSNDKACLGCLSSLLSVRSWRERTDGVPSSVQWAFDDFWALCYGTGYFSGTCLDSALAPPHAAMRVAQQLIRLLSAEGKELVVYD